MLIVTILALGVGCDSQKPGAQGANVPSSVKPGELLARWHFVGTTHLAGDTNASGLREVLALPSTKGLLEGTLQRLASLPQQRLKESTVAGKSAPADLIRPMLDALLAQESMGECRGSAGLQTEWTVAVRAGDATGAISQTNWTQLVTALGASPPLEVKIPGAAVWEAKHTGASCTLRWAQAGGWTVIGWGLEALPNHAEALGRIKSTGRPQAGASEGWLDLELDMGRLAPLCGLPASVKWPQAHLSVVGKGPNVRSSLRLTYAEPLAIKLDPWFIPTNTIREPVDSFTAFRGIGPWLSNRGWVRDLELKPAPNQVFGWAQSQTPFQTYLAWRQPENLSVLEKMGPKLPALVFTNLPNLAVGEIKWQAGLTQLTWQGLPIWVPFIRPASAPESDFLVAGVFPTGPSSRPPAPAELYAQVAGRTNTVYYDWEITEDRLQHWRSMVAFYSMLSSYPPPATNDVFQVWLGDTNLTRRLGNSVTEAALTSPREIQLTRISTIGLTGVETVALARWLSNPAFPGYAAPTPIAPRAKTPGSKPASQQQQPPAPPAPPAR